MVGHALLKQDAYTKPIVAAVNGECVGGGVELLLSTDIRAAAPARPLRAARGEVVHLPVRRRDPQATQQIGHVHAMELLLTGRLIDAARRRDWVSINRVVPAERPDAVGDRDRGGDRGQQPLRGAGGEAADQRDASPITRARREALEQELGDQVRASAHFQEGVAAFREKRRPRYE